MNEFPRRFGPYVLLKPLARGGMGALYLALTGPEESGRLCVIKTVLPHLADKEYLQRFRDEAKVVVRLSHGNLVPVFDSGQVMGEIYLAMDFVQGKDLRATWNRCAKKGIAFPVDVAAHIVRELARGLDYAHGFGDIKLVHRDVSPPNVLLSYGGEVRLTDFGLASSTLKLEKTAPGIIYGKVSYMSPEQARGETLDGRTDLYASGIILWELLTGRQLFPSGKAPGAPKDGHTSEEILKRVRNPELVPPSRRASRVPAELDRIAMKALAPDLKNRYTRCEDLRADLAAFLSQHFPATDSARLASFLRELYAEDMAAEQTERDELCAKAREWYSSKRPAAPPVVPAAALIAAAAAAAPPPIPGAPRPPAPAPAAAPPPLPGASASKFVTPAITPPPAASGPLSTSTPVTPPSGAVADRRERGERGTVVSGPVRHDHSRDKRMTLRDLDDTPLTDSQLSGGRSTAVLGTVVGGRYYVRRLCGEGGMGRVYEAEHIDIGRRVALKILHPAYSQTPDLVERLRREARSASKIAHPNVVDVTDSGTTADGAFFFVMEYLEGIELGELIYREKRLDIRRTLMIGTQICRALQAAHEVSVIHRDLKPENVLILRRDGQRDFVKVLDFGIAKSGSDNDFGESRGGRRLTQPGMTMGTPEYMAPEQASGKPADPRSDIYAVGGLLYEMLSGNPPYEGANFMEILHKKANSAPAPLSSVRNDVPPALENVIMKAMATEPEARQQSMEQLEKELQNVATILFSNFAIAPLTEPDPTPPPGMLGVLRDAASPRSLAERVRGWNRKKVVTAGAAFGLLVAFVVVGATSAARRGGRDAQAPVVAAAPAPAPTAPAPAVAPLPAPATATTPPAVPGTETKAAEATTAEAKAVEATADDEEEAAGDATEAGETPSKTGGSGETEAATKTKVTVKGAASSGAEAKKQLQDAERLLRAERFAEARAIFEKLSKSKRERGSALVGLAEIAFQEKKYGEAARAAELAAERGGGVKARVLLGDAHFRLARYKEAAKAYEDALKIDPSNASAKSGLALATKRM
jgi:serine/threonine protein kinase